MAKIAWMNPAKIHSLTVHCTATPEGRPHSGREIARWDTDKFGQPSYHAVVELDGKITVTLADNQRGAHTGGRNTGNLGIAYVGGVDKAGKPKDTRTPAQKTALREWIAAKQRLYPALRKPGAVKGHRDWPKVAKACPSFDVASEL